MNTKLNTAETVAHVYYTINSVLSTSSNNKLKFIELNDVVLNIVVIYNGSTIIYEGTSNCDFQP